MRFLGFLMVLALIFLVIGLFAGWFSFTEAEGADRTDVTFQIDRDEMKKDVGALKDEVESALGGKAGDLRTIEGTLVSVDTDSSKIEVRPADGENVTLTVAEDASVVVGGEPSAITSLREGDRVEVEVRDEDPVVASKIVVVERTG